MAFQGGINTRKTGFAVRRGNAALPPINTIAPVISGTTLVGSTLSTTDGTWTGTSTITFTYQWKRNGANILGATNSTYLLVTADALTDITCEVTGTNVAGASSAISNTLTIQQAPINTVAPTISGTLIVNQTLSCTTGTWTGTLPITYTYQWKRNGANIGGATNNTYVLTLSDAQSNITCSVTGTNAFGASSANSNALTTPNTPATILGANYYDNWDYTDAATLSVTGTDINSCTSKGLNAAVMASTGTERPKVLLGQINGYQVADLDGVNDYASVATSTAMYNFLHNSAGGTIIFIGRVNDANPNSIQSFVANNGLLSANIGFSLAYDDRAAIPINNGLRSFATRGVSGTINTTSNNVSSDNAFLPQQYNILVNKVDGDAAAASRNIINVNGGANIANNTLTNAPSGANATFNLNLGREGGTSTILFKGQIAEVLIGNIVITAGQQTDLQNYYTFKYGTFPII